MSPQQAPSQSAGHQSRRNNRWDPRQARSFWCLAVLQAVFLAAASAPSPLYPIYQAKWGFSTITLTAVYAVYALGALSALLGLGRTSDYLGRRRVTSVGLLIQIVAMLTFIAAQSVEWLYA